MDYIGMGQLGTFWEDLSFGSTFSEEEILFSLSMKVLEDVLLSDAFTIDDSLVEMDAYNADDERLELGFEFCEIVSSEDYQATDLEITIFPNPFQEFSAIQFQLFESEQVTLTVFDISGKIIKSFTENFPSGRNSFFIRKNDLPSDGIYFFEVKTTENIGVGKLIRN